jgi:formylglycine-generating enzyme required for sulfatase activity
MAAPAQLKSGDKVGPGRFTLIKELGRGGMGVVWLAQDTSLGEQVALKFLPPEVCHDPVALNDLRRETVRSHRLTHPNIIRLHDFHQQPDGVAFISMEYVDGPTLSAWRLQQPAQVCAWEQLAPLMEQLCTALEYAHGEGVIHRDLKPANVMLDSRGRVKLADFGIAAVVSDSVSRVSVRSSTGGTLAYMSPQQLRGQRPTVADDVYALGASLYELLTGRPPFYTGDITHQVLNEPATPVGERALDLGVDNPVPPAVAAVILACLAKEAEHRPQRAPAVADWIVSPAGGLPAAQAVVELPPSSVAPGRPKGRWIAAGVGGLAVVLLAMALFWRPGRAAKHLGVPVEPGQPWTNSRAEELTLQLDRDSTMELKLIPAGAFSMGTPESDQMKQPAETPQHEVVFAKPFYIGATEVTRRQFGAFVAQAGYQTDAEKRGWGNYYAGAVVNKLPGRNWSNPGYEAGLDHPVACVTWDDAKAFCAWLSVKTGRSLRLPTEAEWEYACRAGTTTRYQWGDDSADGAGWANVSEQSLKEALPLRVAGINSKGACNWRDGYAFTSPVRRFHANAWGLFDMHGNLWEWCADWYQQHYYKAADHVDPSGPDAGSQRVIRGGCFDESPREFRSAARFGVNPDCADFGIGFRVCCGSDPVSASPANLPGAAQSALQTPAPAEGRVSALPISSAWLPLDIGGACSADIISTATRKAAHQFTFNGGTLASASWLRKNGYPEAGLPDDGRVPIPDSRPAGFFQVRMPPARNAILLSGPAGFHPQPAALELTAQDRRRYSELVLLHSTCWGNGSLRVNLHYETGPETSASIAVVDWFPGGRTDPLPAGVRVAVTSHDTHPTGGKEAQMLAQKMAVDPQRVLQSLTFSFASLTAPNGQSTQTSGRRFTCGIFAISALPAAAASTSISERWTNSLGMVFVPVPGTQVQFSIWQTRLQDFQKFAKATGFKSGKPMLCFVSGSHAFRDGFNWQKLGFPQGPTHPVVGISWDEAQAFCGWLTQSERGAGRLSANEKYRLPTDLEWSQAVGLKTESGNTPKERSANKKEGDYYWGNNWPPPPGVGNFADEATRADGWPTHLSIIAGYSDGCSRTAPVGSFKANSCGLYDMPGNVFEWCADYFDERRSTRILRGCHWGASEPRWSAAPDDCGDTQFFSPANRRSHPSNFRADGVGFRVVLDNSTSQVALPSTTQAVAAASSGRPASSKAAAPKLKGQWTQALAAARRHLAASNAIESAPIRALYAAQN